jgi:hypothetical protein
METKEDNLKLNRIKAPETSTDEFKRVQIEK